MHAEQSPFRNVAIMADNDVMYHRIGRVGGPAIKLPQMTGAAELCAVGDHRWGIVEKGEIRATYPFSAVRLSLVWKADLEDAVNPESLALDRVMNIFIADLHHRKIDFCVPSEPLSDKTWMATLGSIYGTVPGLETAQERDELPP